MIVVLMNVIPILLQILLEKYQVFTLSDEELDETDLIGQIKMSEHKFFKACRLPDCHMPCGKKWWISYSMLNA